MLIAGWETPLNLARWEAVQRAYEGCEVPTDVTATLEALRGEAAPDPAALEQLLARLAALTPASDFPYHQPDDLKAIRRARPPGPRRLADRLPDDLLLDKLHGGWTGRAVGCALGKPVEVLGVGGHDGRNGRESIKRYLQLRDQWPLTDYFSGAPHAECSVELWFPDSQREHIAFMEPDDDIHYTLIALKILETAGPDFDWQDVARSWNAALPYASICTAETQAILNYNLRTPNSPFRRHETHTTPAFTRRHNNPYREWVGAQIRADGWGYACAGQPELAAELAWRDAHWTHTANGIYGSMLVAAMLAAAFVEPDPRRLLEIGLSEIPERCRLAEAIRDALDWQRDCADFEAFMARVETAFADMSPVHTVNNALIVAMSLLYGDGDPDRSITTCVMAGLDTDSNGATVGSIAGVLRGKAAFGGRLQQALNDTIRPLVFGFESVTMTELAERSLVAARRVQATGRRQ